MEDWANTVEVYSLYLFRGKLLGPVLGDIWGLLRRVIGFCFRAGAPAGMQLRPCLLQGVHAGAHGPRMHGVLAHAQCRIVPSTDRDVGYCLLGTSDDHPFTEAMICSFEKDVWRLAQLMQQVPGPLRSLPNSACNPCHKPGCACMRLLSLC